MLSNYRTRYLDLFCSTPILLIYSKFMQVGCDYKMEREYIIDLGQDVPSGFVCHITSHPHKQDKWQTTLSLL